MLPSPQETAAASSPKPPRRPRAIQACNLCRSKKYKCDGVSPCSHCKRRALNCVYRVSSAVVRATVAPSALQELEQKIQRLEAENSRLRASLHTSSRTASLPPDRKSQGSHEDIRLSVPRSTDGITSPSPAQHGTAGGETLDGNDDATPEDGTEIVEVNPHTHNVEFHGNTSSVAFIGRLREEYGCNDNENQDKPQASSQRQSLVSTFYNDVFGTQYKDSQLFEDGLDNQMFPQCYVFLETYFNKLHYIHPILDKESFYSRCDDLWQGRFQNQSRSFIALYFSLVSLGALIRTWTEEKIYGMGRFEWSRMLFEKAQHALGFPGSLNDLEAAQAYIFLAKVCQNEINPGLAYTYLGMASRILLSIGANRKPAEPQAQITDASKVWWGFYTLEIELSFSLGRPDSLGMDDYHNCPPPPIDGSEADIIPCMIGLSRIMRAISTKVYLHRLSLAQKLQSAMYIELQMDAWVDRLPEGIRPQFTLDIDRQCKLGDPPWAFYQRLVLQIRYYNVKMLLLRPFIVYATKHSEREPSLLDAINKCTDAAAKTIELLANTYRVHYFFHTWWYNITYLTFAVSIILFRAGGRGHDGAMDSRMDDDSISGQYQQSDYIALIEQTLTMLDIMSESVVACKTARIIRQMLDAIHRHNRGDDAAASAPDGDLSGAFPDSNSESMGTGAPRSSMRAAAHSTVVPHAAVTGGDLEMTHLGLESLDTDLWDWSFFEFKDMWENNGSSFHGFS